MGNGAVFTCPHCGEQFHIFTGVGFAFPEVFKETQNAVRNGEYGEEWRKLIDSAELVIADASSYLYRCSHCCQWEVEEDLSLYKAKAPDEIWERRYGEKTAREWGGVPYADVSMDKNDWELLKKRSHKCPHCNLEMKRYKDANTRAFKKLRCPSCGEVSEKQNGQRIMWD